GESLIRFVQRLTSFRHRYPILRRNLFLKGLYSEELGVKDVTWMHPDGGEIEQQHWDDHSLRCFGMLLDGRAQTTGIRQRGKDATILIVINCHHEPVEFTLPACAGATQWCLLIDTNVPDHVQQMGLEVGDTYPMTSRSLIVF